VIRRLAFAAVLASLGLAGSAAAAGPPIQVGTGTKPTVAVDASGSGTGYVAWNHRLSGLVTAVDVCTLPAGASACARTVELAPGQESFAPPYVFSPSPNSVLVLTSVCCGPEADLLYASTNGGQSFSPPVTVGTLAPSGDAILGPGPAISVVTDTVTGGTFFQRLAFDGSTTPAKPMIDGDAYGGTIGFFNGQPVVASWDFNAGVPNHVDFTAYKGAGDHNAAASWTPQAPVGPGSATRIASGSTGLFLMYQDGQPGQEHFYVRKYGGSGFGPPVDISGRETGYVNAFFEDVSGRLHAIWRRNPGLLRYTTSLDGAHWAPVITVVSDTAVFSLKGAATSSGKGWAAYDSNTDGAVKAVPLDYAGAAGGGPTTEHSVSVGSDVITLATPSGCVGAGTITAVLSVRSKKRKGHVVVKVGRVAFSVDRRVRKRVKRAPFRAVIKITGLTHGSTHKISAKAFLRSHHGPKRTRTITNTFTVC
jgi:hypothetical protein